MRTVADLIYRLQQSNVLDASHWSLLRQIQGRFRDPMVFGAEMVRLGWLTRFQLDQLVEGNADLLTLGPYRILDWLGEGGVSQVFKAWHVPFECVVALKVLRPALQGDANALQQFHFEVQVMSRLSHPNIV